MRVGRLRPAVSFACPELVEGPNRIRFSAFLAGSVRRMAGGGEGSHAGEDPRSGQMPLNPRGAIDMSRLQNLDIGNLPAAEDERFEYKSSATPFNTLKDKLARAASGFWNSGGGI